jgi:hypothetical protein
LNAEGVAVLRVKHTEVEPLVEDAALPPVDDDSPWPADDDSAPIEILEEEVPYPRAPFSDVTRDGDDVRDVGREIAAAESALSQLEDVESARAALDVLLDTRLAAPTLLSKREHAARLLWATFGARSGAEPMPGRNEPTFARVIDAIVVEGHGEIVLVTEGGVIVDDDARAETFARRREGADEGAFSLPTRLPTLDEIPLPEAPRDPSAPRR